MDLLWRRFLLLSVMLLPGHAWAATLAGQWASEQADSEALDEMMRLRGVPWALRVLADTFKVSQSITVAPDVVTLLAESAIRDVNYSFVMDDRLREQPSHAGDTQQVRHRWGPDGEMITVALLTLVDGRAATLTSVRSVTDDDQHMTVHHVLVPAGGVPVEATVRYRRVGPAPVSPAPVSPAPVSPAPPPGASP